MLSAKMPAMFTDASFGVLTNFGCLNCCWVNPNLFDTNLGKIDVKVDEVAPASCKDYKTKTYHCSR
jgi:hypothetical protein